MFLWWGVRFLSTLSLRRATTANNEATNHDQISIHALLTESDAKNTSIAGRITLFLSTLSLRRATRYSLRHSASCWHFYPRSPYGERRIGLVFMWWGVRFLSTLSLRRATCILTISICTVLKFLSTLSLRRATELVKADTGEHLISIHALLTESDRTRAESEIETGISIHALLTESDLIWRYLTPKALKFLSTLSLRRATVTVLGIQHRVGISIHALLTESDGTS